MTNYGSDTQFANQMMTNFTEFANSQGYGTSIAPERCSLYSKIAITPGVGGNVNNSPAVVTFYNSGTTNIFNDVQDPVIRNGSQVPTQNLLGIYSIALEVSFPTDAPGTDYDVIAINQVYSDAVFELFIAGDRQFHAKGSEIYQLLGNTPGTAAGVPIGLGQASSIGATVLPSSKLVMPGSTLRAELQIDGTNAAFAAAARHNLTLHIVAFNARR